jgi:hypothetical protein
MTTIQDSNGQEIREGDRVRIIGIDGKPIGPASEALKVTAITSGIGSVPPQVYTEDPCVDESTGHFDSPGYRCPSLRVIDTTKEGSDLESLPERRSNG